MMKDKLVQKSVTEKTAVVNINSPKALANFSKELKKFIVDNKLYTKIKGKNFVHVEGWQFAGASIGIFPIVEKLEDLTSDDGRFKYRAEVALYRLYDGQTIGRGIAICSKTEAKKSSFDEYAIASMAQTRATSKAFRTTLGWLMKLAGYEATPAEEVDSAVIGANENNDEEVETIEEIKLFVNEKFPRFSTVEKLGLLKQIGKIGGATLSDRDYRRLYVVIKDKAQEMDSNKVL